MKIVGRNQRPPASRTKYIFEQGQVKFTIVRLPFLERALLRPPFPNSGSAVSACCLTELPAVSGKPAAKRSGRTGHRGNNLWVCRSNTRTVPPVSPLQELAGRR